MQIKKFSADSINEALGLVKAEFGRDAVILSTKTIRGRGVEVTAAADREAPTLTLRHLPEGEGRGEGHIKTELKDLKELVGSLVSHVQKDELFKGNKKLLELHRIMVSSGIDETLSFKFLQHLFKDVEDASSLVFTLKQFLMKQIQVGEIAENGYMPKVVMFVGPTGVGKTTTIAKLAAINSLQKGKKVALVTLDTYRIAAVEQLKVYAGIIGIPVHVANRSVDFARVAGNIKSADLILVDTSGRSHKDREQMEELRHLHSKGLSLETHLVLSATAKEKDTIDVIRRYHDMQIDRLLFTKLDETSTYGSIFNAAIISNKPLSYFTTGQRVPDDIEPATSERIVDLILGA